jgi:hypothetical protein
MSHNSHVGLGRSVSPSIERRSALTDARSIHDLEAGLRDGPWIGEADSGHLGVDIEAVRNARKARRRRRLAAARGQLRKFRGAPTSRPR